MTFVVFLTCEMCGATNAFWAKHCIRCGLDRAEMDSIAAAVKEAEEWYQEYLKREPGDY
jgi:hypothetical protein